MRLADPPVWREATPEETADHLAGHPVYNDAGEVYEVRETPEGLEVLEGTPADCGCIPHHTYMRGMWGFFCETEDQPYCNFECPHDEEDD